MSIVILTIPGSPQKAFVNAVHEKTGGAVELVIIQSPKRVSVAGRLLRFYKRLGGSSLFEELWYALLLRFQRDVRDVLSYFQAPDTGSREAYKPKVLYTDSVNSDEVHAVLKSISPEVLAVWGSTVLKPHILNTARKSVNLHFGHSPHYRGALANQHAILSGDYSRVGATIHYINGTVDGGDILDQVVVDVSKSPRESFTHLTSEAPQRFAQVIQKLHEGEELPVRAQDTTESRVLLLRHWTPSVRYAAGKRILALEGRSTVHSPMPKVRYRFALLILVGAIVYGAGFALASGL